MKRFVPIAIAITFAGWIACNDPPPPLLYYEDFEEIDPATGTPIGWERTRGPAESATWVETIHEGEHGLRLSGDGITVHGPASSEPFSSLGDVELSIAARCDSGSALSIGLVFADTFGGSYPATASPIIGATWDGGINVTTITFTSFPPMSLSEVSAISITKTGTGSCEISSIIVTDTGVQEGC